jgi:hypothetical protein
VVLNLQLLGQFSDPRSDGRRQALQGQQQLVLPRLQLGISHRRIAKSQITANLVSELSQRLVVLEGQVLFHAADYIVAQPP